MKFLVLGLLVVAGGLWWMHPVQRQATDRTFKRLVQSGKVAYTQPTAVESCPPDWNNGG